jgi:hypothetical protein
MFAIFNYAIIIYSWFLLKETQGKSLEEMEVVFGTVSRLKHRDENRDSCGESPVETIDEERRKDP